MSLLDDAKRLANLPCDGHGFEHFPDCPQIAVVSRIVAVLEIVSAMLNELGEHPVSEPVAGYWRGFAHSLHDTCLCCGVSSYGGYPHADGCEWPMFVQLMQGEKVLT